ncbi:hypothetical protein [Caulobacter endophyticus]|uniref:hypothetical protein n=1 Tax=Caulobacter endophyticus TaxID=2172652 RepID=UPI00240FFE5E|nr:hypothetical protein [Caulobacter endophyticus]MDG2528193.1 hypothetical protein [Caulobacter endophyticus]
MNSRSQSLAFPPGFLKKLRDAIGQLIAVSSANDVPAICRRYGIGDGTREEAMGGKFRYVNNRLLGLPNEQVLAIARTISQEEGDAELLALLASIEPKVAPPKSDPVPGFGAPTRPYYAERTGKQPAGGKIDLKTLKALYRSEYDRWERDGYFQEHFGMYCVDADFLPGKLGCDIGTRMLYHLNKSDLWPIAEQLDIYSEDDLFSVIEFLFDHISKPLDGQHHSYNDCGMHWQTFDRALGQAEYRVSVNAILGRYANGYELSPTGEVMELGPPGTANLLQTEVPIADHNVSGRVDAAIKKYRQRRSTMDDRRDAVRDLADVLEWLRPQVKQVLDRKDEAALFDIANNFSIRHHKPEQKSDYDPAIWLSWMFYFYLATIHAVVRMIEKGKA